MNVPDKPVKQNVVVAVLGLAPDSYRHLKSILDSVPQHALTFKSTSRGLLLHNFFLNFVSLPLILQYYDDWGLRNVRVCERSPTQTFSLE